MKVHLAHLPGMPSRLPVGAPDVPSARAVLCGVWRLGDVLETDDPARVTCQLCARYYEALTTQGARPLLARLRERRWLNKLKRSKK